MATGFAALHEDVVYEILCASPDFATLGTLIKLSKNRTYTVYREHKRIILYNVVSNIIGTCLLDALNIAIRTFEREPVGDNPTSAIMDALMTLTKAESIQIEKVSWTLNKFEALYSQIRKDRRSKESVLTPTESSRLRRAICAIWDLLYVTGDIDDSDAEDEEVDFWADKVQNAFWKHTKSELSDIFGVGVFIQQMSLWFRRGCSPLSLYLTPNNIVVPQDQDAFSWRLEYPDKSMKRYLMVSYDIENESNIRWDDFKDGIRQISAENNYGLELDELQNAQDLILEKRYGVDDTCAKCGQVRGVELFGRSNWRLLQDHLPLSHLVSGLDGALKGNQGELDLVAKYFRTSFHDVPQRFDWPKFIEENFDSVKEEEGDACAWDKDQWYCKECMIGFLLSRFGLWWIVKKKTEGEKPLVPHCWCGYARTQGSGLSHAERLNHFCEPFRRDAVAPANVSPAAAALSPYP